MRSYHALFALRPFRRFWCGLLGVMVADELVRTTLIWHVYDATRSSASVGTLLLFLTGPIVVSGLTAGWLLDRLPRARVMLLDSALRVLVLAAATVVISFGRGDLSVFFIVAAVQGSLLMVVLAGAPAAIAELVPDELRSAANALEVLAFSCSAAIGPLIAGQMLSTFSVSVPLLLASAFYASFGMFVAAMQLGGGTSGRATLRSGSLRTSGMLNPTIVIITLMFLAYNVGYGLFAAGLPEAVVTKFGGTASTYGLLLTVTGLGSSIGAAAAGAVPRSLNLKAAIVIAQVVAGLSLTALSLASNVPSAMAAVAMFGLCSGPLTVWAQTIRMRVLPPEWRGRAFATLRMIMQAGRPIGGVMGGQLFLLVPMTAYFTISGLVVATAAGLGAFQPSMRSTERPTGMT